MKLHSPQFEKALRRRVRETISASPSLKKDFKAANKYSRSFSARLIVRPLISCLLALIIYLVLQHTENVTPAVGLVNLWAFTFIANNAKAFLGNLYNSPDLAALSFLPVESETVLRRQLHKSARTALWLLFDLLASFAVIALHVGSVSVWLAVVPLALLSCLHILGLAIVAVAYRPGFPYPLISTLLFGIAFVTLVGHESLVSPALSVLTAASPILNFVLPSGWVPSLMEGVVRQHYYFLILLLPIAATMFAVKPALQRIRSFYQFVEPIHPEAPDLLPGNPEAQETADTLMPSHRHGVQRVGITEIETFIERREFLAPTSWHDAAWVERFLWRWLTARERVLIDFIWPEGLSLLPSWLKLFRNLAVGTGIILLARQFGSPALASWLLLSLLFITACHTFGLLAATGRAFQQVPCSGARIPFYVGFGIGFSELAQVFAKVAAVQMPLVLVGCLPPTALTFVILGMNLKDAFPTGVKVAGLLYASRYLFLTFSFSSCTNDSTGVSLRRITMLGMMIVLILSALSFGTLGILTNGLGSWVFCGIAVALAWGFLKVYEFFYHSRTFDLMATAPQQF